MLNCTTLPREYRTAPSPPPSERAPCPKPGPVRRPYVVLPVRCGSSLTGTAQAVQVCPLGSGFSPPGKLHRLICLLGGDSDLWLLGY